MNKQWIALALAFAMGAATGLPLAMADSDAQEKAEQPVAQAGSALTEAAPADEAEKSAGEAKKADPEGQLTFANVQDRMRENYYPVKVLEESIQSIESLDYDVMYERLRLSLNEISSGERMALQYGLLDNYSFAQIQQGYASVRSTFESIKKGDMQKDNAKVERQLRNAQNQVLRLGETLYINLKALEAGDAAAGRGIAKAERSLKELQLRNELGQVSDRATEQVRASLSQAESKRATLRMNRDTTLLQMKAMVGVDLGSGLTLTALPDVTAEQLKAMDLEADLAKAKEASWDLYDARETWNDARKAHNTATARYFENSEKDYVYYNAEHTWQSAQYQYESEVQNFELSFRTLYAQVKDYAQALEAARAAYADKQKDYTVSKLKYEQGNISKNAYADASDALADARDAISTAERDLFNSYRSYWWAVEYGILD